MKKITRYLITLLIMFTLCFIATPSKEVEAATTYKENATEFRAAWVSYYTGDISYSSQEQYIEDIDYILNVLEYYNMNAIVFHVRANHDAWYNSKINKINSQLSNVSFDEFDPLEYVITECHKRGIEFHAWMNPYRIGSTYKTEQAITSAYSNFATNPATIEDNILMGSTLQILDPGRPEVRKFLVETCMELVENYDVDAIHFDDYFYAAGIDDSDTRAIYGGGVSTEEFRRTSVTTFIGELHRALRQYNEFGGRYVQLGIAPTGVYRNAPSSSVAMTPLSEYKYNERGDLIYPIGATTGCQEHYTSYLYCDTLDWVNNEFIDYIIPQTYWSSTHSKAPFERLINWWNMAVKNKKVNLYSGMGIYMWYEGNLKEAYNQTVITSNLDYVQGTCIYSYRQVRYAYNGSDYYAKQQMNNIKNDSWYNLSILPEIRTATPIHPGAVEDLVVNDNILVFSPLEDAKFYVIYRDEEKIEFTNDQIVDIIGSDEEFVIWADSVDGDYVYDVVPLSYTNTLGDPSKQVATTQEPNIIPQISLDGNSNNLLEQSRVVSMLNTSTPTLFLTNNNYSQNLSDYNWKSDNENAIQIDENGNLTIKGLGTATISGISKTDESVICLLTINVYTGNTINNEYTVTFRGENNEVLKTQTVKYGQSATAPEVPVTPATDRYVYTFMGWSEEFNNVTSNLVVDAIIATSLRKYEVTWKNPDGEVLKVENIQYGTSANPPLKPTLDSTVEHTYTFKEWDKDYTVITRDTVITAVYNQIDNLYEIKFETNGGTKVSTGYYYYYENIYYPNEPTKEGYDFGGWYYDENFETPCNFPIKLTKDTKVYAKWTKYQTVNLYNHDGTIFKTLKVEKGNTLIIDSNPTLSGYIFKGWTLTKNSNEVFNLTIVIEQDYNLYPIFELEIITYTVTFYDFNNQVVSTQTVNKNSSVTPPVLSKVEGYNFVEWDQDLDNITSDLDVRPIFEQVPTDDKKNCSCNGNSIILISLSFMAFAILWFKRRK